jgi:formamidopyrimidine-DNA glycosylase
MPELPEVETIVRDLRRHLVGRRFRSVEVSRYPMRRAWLSEWAPHLVGRRIIDIRRRGKWIVFVFKDDVYLIIHLGMTGNLTIHRAREPVASHTHMILQLHSTTRQLRFRDVRRFGSATLARGERCLEQFFADIGLGPEPFEVDFGYWRARLARTARSLKSVLLDQTVVAGIGNIYADESLFLARLHPAQLGRNTDSADARRLRRAITQVLDYAIKRRGSTISNYVDSRGRSGGYQHEFRVYDRVGEPCPRCAAPIERIRLAGRSTHFCPRCQRKKAARRRRRHKTLQG